MNVTFICWLRRITFFQHQHEEQKAAGLGKKSFWWASLFIYSCFCAVLIAGYTISLACFANKLEGLTQGVSPSFYPCYITGLCQRKKVSSPILSGRMYLWSSLNDQDQARRSANFNWPYGKQRTSFPDKRQKSLCPVKAF